MDATHQKLIEKALNAADVSARVDSHLAVDEDPDAKVGYVDIISTDGPLAHARVHEALARLGMMFGIDAGGTHVNRGNPSPAFVVAYAGLDRLTLRDDTVYRKVPAETWWGEHDWLGEKPPF